MLLIIILPSGEQCKAKNFVCFMRYQKVLLDILALTYLNNCKPVVSPKKTSVVLFPRMYNKPFSNKTALYYLPNALIREYIAYVVMHKRRHMIFVLICFLSAFAISMILIIRGWL